MQSWIPAPALEVTPFEDDSRGWLDRAMTRLADSRAHRVLCIVVGIWILNAFDLTLTILAHNLGVLDEENPLAHRFLLDGTLSIMLFKIGLVLVGSYPLLRFRVARIAELGALVVFAIYALLAIRWSACYELYAYSINSGFFFAEVQ